MLTFIKQIFTWWNHETIGTKIYTIFFGKLVGTDIYGNKYYENKKKIKDGLYTTEKLMLQKYLMNGTLGYTL